MQVALPQPQIRKRTSYNVDRQLFPTALRELRTDFTNRNVLIGLLGSGIILGISGPFNTLGILPLIPRLIYWTVIVFCTFGVGSVVSEMTTQLLRGRPLWHHLLISSLAVGIAVTVVLTALNLIAFGVLPETAQSWIAQWAIVTAISAVIDVSAKLMRVDPKDQPPSLLDRLPFGKRGGLIALSAEDHYVKVETTQGTEMLLMRLSDAMNEVGSTTGLQIHRSHWVALDHIKDVHRINDRGEVTLSNGQTRPISRGYMSAVRDSGLLPKGHKNG